MLRNRCLLVVVFLAGVAGCGGQSSPDVEPPQNANPQGKSADKKRADHGRTDGRPKVELVKVLFLRRGLARQPIKSVTVKGDLPEKGKATGHQFTNVQKVEGLAPKQGTYYLLAHVTLMPGSVREIEEDFIDPTRGPYFDRRLPAGTRLANVVWMGTCRADVQGWTDDEPNALQKGLRFQVYEASYEKR